MGHEIEKGFGTGLRAQLERRRDGEPTAEQPDVPAAEAPPETPQPEQEWNVVDIEGDALRAQLEAALVREHGLRAELAELQEVTERGHTDAQSLSLRSTEVDARAARIAALEAKLDERERELVARAESAAAEQQRLAELKSELTAVETRT